MYKLQVHETQRVIVFKGDEYDHADMLGYWRTVAMGDTRERLECFPHGIEDEMRIVEC